MSKKMDLIRLLIILVVTAILMSTASVAVYEITAKPKFYAQFMELGNKYLDEGKYEESIIAFEKAIKIERKSTEARVGLAKGSIEVGDVDTAVRVLKEAQKLDFDNTELLEEIVTILNIADPDAAYEILMNYIQKYGDDNLDPAIEQLLNSANEAPQIPWITPPSGTYIRTFLVKLQADAVRVGHSFYYTTDGSIPDKSSTKYRGGITVENDMYIRFIGYNPAGAATEVFEANYFLDTTLEGQITALIETSKTEMENTEVGTEVGNCIEGAKEELQVIVDNAESMLNNDAISLEEGQYLHHELEEGLNNFRLKIIVPTEREALNTQIEKAENVVRNATEGNNVGQYRAGAKRVLNEKIATAKEVYENIVARQEQIDQAEEDVKNALKSFEAKKITELDKIISDAGAKIGPVTVSLLWNTTDDLDLHVTSPRGDTVSYRNKRSSSGGSLDVDRQVTTFVENPVENIYWQNPPSGTYTVKVNVFSKRSSGVVPISVRVIVNGEARVYQLNVNSGMTNVCTFSY